MSFGKVYLACLWIKIVEELTDVNEENYVDFIKRFDVPVESVNGGRQVKPYLDCDPVMPFDYTDADWEADILKNKLLILTCFAEITLADIRCIKRKYQVKDKKKDGIKCSVHYIVDKIRMSAGNMLDMFASLNLEGFDKGVYSKNRFLTSIYTNKKIVNGENKSLPMFMPDGDDDIKHYLVSYVEEDFVDYDLKIAPAKSVLQQINEACDKLKVKGNKIVKVNDDEEGNDEDINEYDIEKSKKYIKKVCKDLDKKRLDEYDDWIKVMFALINICNQKKIKQTECRQILHDVSAKSNGYEEDRVDKWINTNIDKAKEGLGLNFLINTCIKQDTPELWKSDYEKPSYLVVKKAFERHCFFCVNNIVYIDINEECDEINQEVFYMLNQNDIKMKYGHLSYFEKKCKDGKWEIRERKFIKEWIKDSKIKRFQSLCFIPKELDEHFKTKHYNLFTGFKASLKPVKRNYEIIQPFLNHIKEVLVNGNEEYYYWLMQYFAYIIKNPDKKTSIIIIFQGKQGTGKSIIVDTFYEKIIGDNYATATNAPMRDFFGNFNSKLSNKVFSVINEAGNELRGCMDKIKDLSTAPTINIEKKGKDPIVFTNYNNFIGTTNNMNPFDIAWDDRRFAWFKVNTKYLKNDEYFQNLADTINHEDFDSSLYHYLKEEVKINIKCFQKTRPQTQEYEDVRKRNLPNVIKFLADTRRTFHYRKGREGEEEISCVSKKELYSSYKSYCDMCKYTAYNYTAFKSHIKEIGGVEEKMSNGEAKYKFKKVDFENYIKDFDDEQGIEEEEESEEED
jgi:hypothetical protein